MGQGETNKRKGIGDRMYLVKIDTSGRWSGQRIVTDIQRKTRSIGKKNRKYYYYRVTLVDGTTVSVDNVEIIKKIVSVDSVEIIKKIEESA